jgi:hypothetical protein
MKQSNAASDFQINLLINLNALQVGGVSNLRQQNMVMNPAVLGHENDFAGEDQQQLYARAESSCQRGYYIRTIIASAQLEKKNTGHESQRACHQDELIGSKPPVVK